MRVKGSELFIQALKKEKVEKLFAYPGGMAIDLFDALYGENEIEVILPRHEQGLIHAADGYARSTGKVGVCLVTSGPGATNLVTGIATANYDSVPLVCFTGQVPTHLIGRDAFQEVDIVDITKSICKAAFAVKKREELQEIIKEAFHVAKSGRPGPVVVDIPKDIQMAYGEDDYEVWKTEKEEVGQTEYIKNMALETIERIKKSKRPVLLIGGGVFISAAQNELKEFAKKGNLPIITTIMGKGTISTSHPLYLGNIGQHGSYACNMAVDQCDLLLAIGTRFNDRITGKISEFAKNAYIIHADIAPDVLSKNVKADIEIVADARIFMEELVKCMDQDEMSGWKTEEEKWIQKLLQWKNEFPIQIKEYSKLTPDIVLRHINAAFKKSIVVTDVGQNQLWTTQFIALDENRRMLTSGGLGTMGFGLPAAIGAQIGNPEVDVICISGDGGIQMNIQELATAALYELPVIICIFNNSYLGNVRQWQEMFFDKRYSSTCLKRRKSCGEGICQKGKKCPPYLPDYMKLAESYEIKGIRVEKEDEVEEAFTLAKRNKVGPTLIEFIMEEEANVLPIVPGGKALREMVMDY